MEQHQVLFHITNCFSVRVLLLWERAFLWSKSIQRRHFCINLILFYVFTFITVTDTISVISFSWVIAIFTELDLIFLSRPFFFTSAIIEWETFTWGIFLNCQDIFPTVITGFTDRHVYAHTAIQAHCVKRLWESIIPLWSGPWITL